MPVTRFGLLIDLPRTLKTLRETAGRAEGWGFDTLLVTDHLRRQVPVFSTLGFLAAVSPLRLGTLVISNEFRHPVIVAKETAMLDVLCAGRLDVGLGIGWNAAEFASAGMVFPPREERIVRLTESIAVMRALWSGEVVQGTGHFPLDGMIGDPLPVQKPHPPLLLPLGMGGSLAVAAREADLVEISSNGASESVVLARLEEFRNRRSADAQARSKAQIAALVLHCAGPGDARSSAEARRLNTTMSDLTSRPSYLMGSVVGMEDELRRRSELYGLSYVIVPLEAAELMAPVAEGLRR